MQASVSRCTVLHSPAGVYASRCATACLNSAAATCRARVPRPKGAQHQGLWSQSRSTQSLESGRARPALQQCRWAWTSAVRRWCYCMPSDITAPAMHCPEQTYPGADNTRNASACWHSKQLSCAPFWRWSQRPTLPVHSGLFHAGLCSELCKHRWHGLN